MDLRTITRKPVVAALILIALLAGAAFAADSIKGQVLGEGAPIAKSTVSLWEASAGAPKQLAQTKTNDDGRFAVRVKVHIATRSSIWWLTVAYPRPAKPTATIPPLRCYWLWAAILQPA